MATGRLEELDEAVDAVFDNAAEFEKAVDAAFVAVTGVNGVLGVASEMTLAVGAAADVVGCRKSAALPPLGKTMDSRDVDVDESSVTAARVDPSPGVS